ncbi:MAG: aminoacyl-histidine dipeptidase [Saprospiraceae bacterium]|nr:aminoacyl-histidine dipeptidase [Saprospiraceae bacterium]
MNNQIKTLEPKELWNYFAELNAIPRPSKKEHRAIEFAKNFGLSLGLETIVDEIGNVIIKKKATPGMEDRVPVIMQAHLDMVAQKNSDVDFDFDTQGIEMIIDGDWVKAKGTTLGADNGIGVSAIMAVFASDNIKHPDIEALFTMDEETGMTGAQELKEGLLNGKIMLNLDSEEDDEMTIGCAGGVDVLVEGKYKEKEMEGEIKSFEIFVSGLAGGHSGIDIHLYKGNANKIMNRILLRLSNKIGFGLKSVEGGSLRNAIPRESRSVISIKADKESKMFELIDSEKRNIISEYKTKEANLKIEVKEVEAEKKVFKGKKLKKTLDAIQAGWNGVFRMSPDVEGLTQTSTNMARIVIKEGKVNIDNLTRSSIESEKFELARTIKSAFKLVGYKVKFEGSYPGWQPDVTAAINTSMKEVYKKNFGSEPHITACHAGLECGLIKEKYPDVDMISFGPNIRNPHSPDERVQISSVQKFWKLLIDTLGTIPKR